MESWRERILQAVEADPRSDRAISVDARLGVNFVNELRNSDKEPGVNKVIRLAATLGLSLGYVFNGVEISEVQESDLQVYLSLTPESRQQIIALAQKIAENERA